MQINQTNTNFTSRNAVIRKADDLARRVNTLCPRVSQTLICDFKHIDEHRYVKIKLNDKTRQMRNLKQSRFFSATHPIQKLISFIQPVQERKVGNCGESAQIAAIAAQMNGIKDFTIASVEGKNGYNFGHAVLLVNDKKPYIIDPWLGFADYLDGASQRYQKDYSSHFDFKKKKLQRLIFEPEAYKKDEYNRFLRKPISSEDLETLKKLYPQLIIRGK